LEPRIEVQSGTGTRVIEDLAGAGSRAYAYVFDWHIRILLVLVWYLGCMAFLRTADLIGFGRQADFNELAWMNAPPLLLYALYHPVLELAMAGNSPGKRYAGVAVVDEQGAPPTAGAIIIRNVFRLIDGLPFAYTIGLVTVMLSRQHVRFGDMVAGTILVKKRARVTRSLDTIARIYAAPIDAKSAELVLELLDRWTTIEKKQRVRLGQALLERAGISVVDSKPKTIRKALEQMLDPA
jgi:uncharacterized RDD family membrane protein YckC